MSSKNPPKVDYKAPLKKLTYKEVKGTPIFRATDLDYDNLIQGNFVSCKGFIYKGVVFFFEEVRPIGSPKNEDTLFSIVLGEKFLSPTSGNWDKVGLTDPVRGVLIRGSKCEKFLSVKFSPEYFKSSILSSHFNKYRNIKEICLEDLIQTLDDFVDKVIKMDEEFDQESASYEPLIRSLWESSKDIKDNLCRFRDVSWWKMSEAEIKLFLRNYNSYRIALKSISKCLSKVMSNKLTPVDVKNLWSFVDAYKRKNVKSKISDMFFKEESLNILEDFYRVYKIKDPLEKEDFSYERGSDESIHDIKKGFNPADYSYFK